MWKPVAACITNHAPRSDALKQNLAVKEKKTIMYKLKYSWRVPLNAIRVMTLCHYVYNICLNLSWTVRLCDHINYIIFVHISSRRLRNESLIVHCQMKRPTRFELDPKKYLWEFEIKSVQVTLYRLKNIGRWCDYFSCEKYKIVPI